MSRNAEALSLLIPVDLGGDFAADLALKGQHLDTAQTRADTLLTEMSPAGAYELLTEWERVYGLPVSPDDPLQVRQTRVLQKMRELGRLDRNYFIQLAGAYGYRVWIDELHPFMAGWGFAGEELGDDDSDYCWRVWITDSDGYYFRVGESCAGEHLSYGYDQLLMDLLNELKPAHTFVEILWA